MFYNDKRIPEPFCIVDMGVKSNELLIVKLAEGAVVGLKEVEKQVQQEIG